MKRLVLLVLVVGSTTVLGQFSQESPEDSATPEPTDRPEVRQEREEAGAYLPAGALPSNAAQGADHHVRATVLSRSRAKPMSDIVSDKSNTCGEFPPCDESGNTTMEWTDRIYESGKYRRATIRVEEVLKGPWAVGSEHTFYYLSSCRTCGEGVVVIASSDSGSGYPYVTLGDEYFLTLTEKNHSVFEGRRTLSGGAGGVWKIIRRPAQEDVVEWITTPTVQRGTFRVTVANYRAQVACPEMTPPDPDKCGID